MPMTHILRAALAALAISAGPALADSYTVTFRQGPRQLGAETRQYRLAEVEAHLTPRSGEVGLVRSHEDTGLPLGWSTFVYRPTAEAADGSPLRVTYATDGRWRVEGWKRGEITLRYTMQLQHDRFLNDPGENELAYARPYGVMWTGRALLMEGAPAENIAVAFNLPEGWRVTSPWKSTTDDGAHFVAKDTDDLLDSGFMAGTHIERSVKIAGGEARVAVGPAVKNGVEVVTGTLNRYFPAYQRLFGEGLTNTPLIILADATFWGGGVMGRTISLSAGGALEGPYAEMATHVIAHEGFHLWNSDDRWRYDQKNGELEWVKEGLAEYYTFLTGRRVGARDEASLLDGWGARAGFYLTALRERSIAEGGATKLSGGETSYNLVYSGGMMVAAVLDARIRAASRGTKSLDDVIREIHARFGKAGKEPLTPARLGLLLKTYAIDGTFLRTYVERREPLPLAADFSAYGLKTEITDSTDSVKVRIIKDNKADARARNLWAGLTAGSN